MEFTYLKAKPSSEWPKYLIRMSDYEVFMLNEKYDKMIFNPGKEFPAAAGTVYFLKRLKEDFKDHYHWGWPPEDLQDGWIPATEEELPLYEELCDLHHKNYAIKRKIGIL